MASNQQPSEHDAFSAAVGLGRWWLERVTVYKRNQHSLIRSDISVTRLVLRDTMCRECRHECDHARLQIMCMHMTHSTTLFGPSATAAKESGLYTRSLLEMEKRVAAEESAVQTLPRRWRILSLLRQMTAASRHAPLINRLESVWCARANFNWHCQWPCAFDAFRELCIRSRCIFCISKISVF